MQGLGGEVVLVAQFRPWAQQQFLNGLAEKRYCSHHNPGNKAPIQQNSTASVIARLPVPYCALRQIGASQALQLGRKVIEAVEAL